MCLWSPIRRLAKDGKWSNVNILGRVIDKNCAKAIFQEKHVVTVLKLLLRCSALVIFNLVIHCFEQVIHALGYPCIIYSIQPPKYMMI